MDLRVVFVCQDVSVHVPPRGVLFRLVVKFCNDGAVVTFNLTVGLWVVRCGKEVLNPQDFVDMLRNP